MADDLLDAALLVHRISPTFRPTELDDFARAFESRYGDREVPLLEALDPDCSSRSAASRRS